MSNSSFRFKQFSISHDKCAMKVGTDGVLLGAWTAHILKAVAPDHILDIGTGSGLIALMLAQQFTTALITAIDIDKAAATQALENFQQSPWAQRLNAIQGDIRNILLIEHYDIITSNPPYFQNSLRNPNLQKSLARHTDTLPYEQLISIASRAIRPNGTITLIIPHQEENNIITLTKHAGLHPSHITRVRSYPEKDYKRTLVALTPQEVTCLTNDITLEDLNHQRSYDYQILTQDYYL